MRSTLYSMPSPLLTTSFINGDAGQPRQDGLKHRPAAAAAASANGHANGNGHALTALPSPPLTPRSFEKAREAIDWEVPRKLLHSSIGFVTLYLWDSHGSPTRIVVGLSAALAFIIPADVLRLNSPAFERAYERVVGFLMRESEKNHSNGVIWYIFGAIYVLALLPLDIAVVSILILSWADTAASTFGRLWGRHTPRLPRRLLGLPLAPRKSLAGFAAASLTGAAIAAGFWGSLATRGVGSPYVPALSWSWDQGFAAAKEGGAVLGGWLGLGLIALVAGAVSGVAEALDLGSLDDNLTLPVIAGTCLWAFFKLVSSIF